MSYIRTKKIKGRPYLYEQESYRSGKSVKTRTLRYLGPGSISFSLMKAEPPAGEESRYTVHLNISDELLHERTSPIKGLRLFTSKDVLAAKLDEFFEEFNKLPRKMGALIKEVCISSKKPPARRLFGMSFEARGGWVETYKRLIILGSDKEDYQKKLEYLLPHETGHGVFEEELKNYFRYSATVKDKAKKKYPRKPEKARKWSKRELEKHPLVNFMKATQDERPISLYSQDLKSRGIGDIEKEFEYFSENFAEAVGTWYSGYYSPKMRSHYFKRYPKTYTTFREILKRWEK